jgi:TrmH family RNA methyltransferase
VSFVVEGPSLVAQAAAAGWEIEAQFVAPALRRTVPAGTATPVFELAPNVIERVASTDSAAGRCSRWCAVSHRRRCRSRRRLRRWSAHRLGDPGNAGTIIRSAEAAGAQAVVFTPGSVDPFNPKVVRATAGSLFRVPGGGRRTRWRRQCRRPPVLATSSHHGTAYTDADLTGRSRWWWATRPTACGRRCRSTGGSRFRTPAAPRASTWRWRPRCSHLKSPGNGVG